uniref:Uncharacterized protein n=1 Tax=Brassica oleracea TaxID=3712 RepID=A0A3P6DF82_BRAOL|nr:unnamed protein product [Brassica oleracea]
MGNITQNSSITNVSPLPSIILLGRPCRMLRINFKDGLTHQAGAARKEILNNKRTIGIPTSNRGPYNSTQSSPTLANLSTIGYQETISRSTLRKRRQLDHLHR